MSKIIDGIERPMCFGVNYDFTSRKSDRPRSECCFCPHGSKCKKKALEIQGERMVTLRFTKEECQILKVAMLDYQNGMEATGLPKNDPTEIGILRKICAGLGMELVIHKNGLHSEPKSPIKEEAK